MTTTLFKECPKCTQAAVSLQPSGEYVCESCGLSLKERAILNLFKKGRYGVTSLGEGNFSLAEEGLKNAALSPDSLKIVLGNIYTEDRLAEIAGGNIESIRPVKTILAQIILEQLREECFINVNGVRRAEGPVLVDEASWYIPDRKTPQAGLEWQDEGNLFCTTHRLVLPSDKFTFIRLDRKVVAVQAYSDGIALQRKGEKFATYFVDCFPHEAALVAAYVMAKVPKLRPAELAAKKS